MSGLLRDETVGGIYVVYPIRKTQSGEKISKFSRERVNFNNSGREKKEKGGEKGRNKRGNREKR